MGRSSLRHSREIYGVDSAGEIPSDYGEIGNVPSPGGGAPDFAPYEDALFHFLAPDDAGVMQMVRKGESGAATVAHADPVYAADDQGVFQKYPANAPVWYGAACELVGEAGSDVVVASAKRGGQWLAELPQLQYSPALTNSILDSSVLVGVNWAQTGAVVVSPVPGLTGEADAASACAVAQGTSALSQDVVIPADTSTHTAKYFIRKDGVQTRFPVLVLELFGVAQQIVGIGLNTVTGYFWATSGTTSAYRAEVRDTGLWWEVSISVINASNTAASVLVYPAGASTEDGDVDRGASGSVDVGNVEVYVDTDVSQVIGLGPIFTAGASVSQARTAYTFPSGYMTSLGSVGGLFAECSAGLDFMESEMNSVTYAIDFGKNTANTGFFSYGLDNRSGTPLRSLTYRSSLSSIVIPNGDISDYVHNKIGRAFDWATAQLNAVVIDGVWGADGAGADWFTGLGTSLRINAPGGGVHSLFLKNLAGFVTADYAAAKAKMAELSPASPPP